MDIIEANKCLRHLYGPPRKGSYDNKEVGVLEGEPDNQPRSFKEAAKARLATSKAADAAAQLVNDEDDLQEEYAAIEADGDEVGVDEVDEVDEVYPTAILVSITPNYFLTSTPRPCQDLLFIVYIYIGAPWSSWI